MRYLVTLYAYVDVAHPSHVPHAQQAMQKLITNPMVRAALDAQSVKFVGGIVGGAEPAPAAIPQLRLPAE